MRRYAIRDDQWERIKDFLPGREGHVGGTAADNRLFVDAVVYRLEPAFRGAIFPSASATGTSSTNVSPVGEERGFRADFQLLASDHDNEYMMIDATIVRAHQHSAGSKKNGEQAIGRSRGGLTTKIHALVDAFGNPVELMLTPGQVHDLACAEPLIENADPEALIGDKAFDADPFIDVLTERRITPVIRRRPTARPSGPAISRSTANAISSSASSINSSTFGPSPRATTNSPETFSQEFNWLPLSSCSTEYRP